MKTKYFYAVKTVFINTRKKRGNYCNSRVTKFKDTVEELDQCSLHPLINHPEKDMARDRTLGRRSNQRGSYPDIYLTFSRPLLAAPVCSM
jgi:hypothetical protein